MSNERHGHLKLGTMDLRQNLYRLFCFFYSSETLFQFTQEEKSFFFHRIREDFEEMEIHRALIAVAVRLRVVEEEFRDIFKLLPDDLEDRVGVGALQEDIKKPEEKPLSLREGCNKIVHATKIEFERTFYDPDGEVGSLKPWVRLHGTKGTKEPVNWKAKLDIKPFVDFGSYFCTQVDEQQNQ